jgi:FixJ family two-component response regulator
MNTPTTVFVVDDDRATRQALTRLLRAAGFDARCFPSARAFLEEHDPAMPGCLILDVAMPESNGFEVQYQLGATGCERSIIFLTGHGDIPMSVQAMKAGAVDFLTKPVDDVRLLAAIRSAVEKDREARGARAERQAIRERLATLTQREREVLEQVVAGQLNKQVAANLGTVEKTIKVHRARVMTKMGVKSFADLVRVAMQSGIGIGPKSNSHAAHEPANVQHD